MRLAGSYNPHFKEEHPNLYVIFVSRVREMSALLSRRARSLWSANVVFYLSGSSDFRFLGVLESAKCRGPTSDASVTAVSTRLISQTLRPDDQDRLRSPSVKMNRLRRPKAPSTDEETF